MNKIRWDRIFREIKSTGRSFFLAYAFLYMYIFFTCPFLCKFILEHYSKLWLLFCPFVCAVVFPVIAEFWEAYHVESYSLFLWLHSNPILDEYVAGFRCVRYLEKKNMAFYRNGFCIFLIDKRTYYKWSDVFEKGAEWTCGVNPVATVSPDPPDDVPLW